MRRAISGVALVACLSTGAVAFDTKDASYFCTAEISAGFAFDRFSKKWDSTTFRPNDKFVLRMKYLQSGDINVTITQAGSNYAAPCAHNGSRGLQVNEIGLFRCHANLVDYLISVRTNRFLAFYVGMYVPELPEEPIQPDTPSVTGGTCTKIE